MINLVIYTRQNTIIGRFDYNGTVLSYLNHFDNIRILPNTVKGSPNGLPWKFKNVTDPIILHPQNIMFASIQD